MATIHEERFERNLVNEVQRAQVSFDEHMEYMAACAYEEAGWALRGEILRKDTVGDFANRLHNLAALTASAPGRKEADQAYKLKRELDDATTCLAAWNADKK